MTLSKHVAPYSYMFSFLPMPDEYGMDLAPNTASSMAVQLNKVIVESGVYSSQITRQKAPYTSRCVDNWEKSEIQVPDGTNYSLAVGPFSLVYVLYTCIMNLSNKNIIIK